LSPSRSYRAYFVNPAVQFRMIVTGEAVTA
jgi:hypothetical protein